MFSKFCLLNFISKFCASRPPRIILKFSDTAAPHSTEQNTNAISKFSAAAIKFSSLAIRFQRRAAKFHRCVAVNLKRADCTATNGATARSIDELGDGSAANSALNLH